MSESILVLNAGSSSIKFSLFAEHGGELLAQAHGQVESLYTAAHFVAKDGSPWSLRKGYDVSVIFPLEHLTEDQRPAWLALDGLRQAYPVSGDMCRSQYPCMVEARYIDESESAIPADRVAFGFFEKLDLRERARINGAAMHSDLYLRPGRYRLTVTNSDNQPIVNQNINVGERSGNNS